MRLQVFRRPAGRRAWVALAALVLGVLAVAASAGASVAPVQSGALEDVQPVVAPVGLSNAPTTVILELAQKPVVVADADSKDAGNGALSKGQKDQIRQQLRSAQAPVAAQAQQLGGQVLASYQSVYNGIKVVIAANKTSALKAIPGVVAVHQAPVHTLTNIHGVPQIGGPLAWDGLNGVHGEGIKIADIDTGIDYTHADFGGSGNVADYQAALASDKLAPNPAWFGPNAPRVKGGIDLVGDDYNADPTSSAYQPVPHQDPNPLDCNGHGTHTAGTAAGNGVLANGTAYTGPYNATTISSHSWNVGPGVAPKADIYAVRVFGCEGSTNVVTDAIEWAVDNNMDVINMSLGAPFGSPDDPDAVAARNAARDGVIVVESSGNNGPAPYMTGSPGTAAGTLSVAAEDPTSAFPGANLTLSTGATMKAIDANGFQPLPTGPFNVKVIKNGAKISLGCSVAADQASGPIPPNTYIVVARGTCARVAKAIFGQQAGAAGVIMVNTSSAFPPFEGKITNDPDPAGPPLFGGFNFTVTIPFLGVQGGSNPAASANGVKLLAADGGTVTLAAADIANPGFSRAASFTSFGPDGSNSLKPQVTAPGVSIASAGMGTGTEAAILSGTSMAAPHTTGSAALVRQAHPSWGRPQYWETAIENTASPALLPDYTTIGEGAGLVQVQNAVKTNVIALGGDGRDTLGTVDFGLATLDRDLTQDGKIILRNFGSSPATFNVADQLDQGSPHTLTVSDSTVTVPAGSSREVHVTLNVPAATAGDAISGLHTVSGVVTFTPASASDNSGIALRVPYLLVPQAISHVKVTNVGLGRLKQGSVDVTIRNDKAAATGVADWFAWGLKDQRDPASLGLDSDNLLNAGVQSFPTQTAPSGAGTGWALFALQTARAWQNPAMDEFDINVDVNHDGVVDYDVAAFDFGAFTTGTYSGEEVAIVIPTHGSLAGSGSIRYDVQADFNGTTMEVPVDFSQLCRGTGSPCPTAGTPITYTVAAFGRNGTSDDFNGQAATFDLFHPAISSANFEDVVAPGAATTDTLSVDKAEYQVTPQLGVLILSQNNVSHDNREEALTVPIPASAVR